MPQLTKTKVGEALRLYADGWWVVPQYGRGASVLGWDKWRLEEGDLREAFADPQINIAVVLSQSPYMDVECDSDEAAAELDKVLGFPATELMTPTWQSRRGVHRLFVRPSGDDIPKRAKVEIRGIEFRLGNGKGCLTTLPPSTADGFTRTWLPGLSIHDVHPMDLPPPLLELLRRHRNAPSTNGQPEVLIEIPEGRRTDVLNKLGCRLVRCGLTSEGILEVLKGENKRCCKPPLTESEIKKLAAGVEKIRNTPRPGAESRTVSCTSWQMLRHQFKKAMRWPDSPGVGLDLALSVILAVVISTDAKGDQLWVKIVSPPSSGKSVLCEAISTNRDYVFPKDTLTSLFSGLALDQAATEDLSLAAKLNNKTLVIKDADTLLKAPNKDQILSQLRALYDRAVRTSYGNNASRNYENMSVTVILAGTSSIRELDTSELGERFLDCVIIDRIDEDEEDEVSRRVAYQAARNVKLRMNGSADGSEDPQMVLAKQMTGGYIDHLRKNAESLFDNLEQTDDAIDECRLLAKFIAHMRARPSAKQKEKAERELSYRLVAQLIRLASCLGVVLNRSSTDEEVMARVRTVAMHTARGRVMEVCRYLRDAGQDGKSTAGLALLCNRGEAEKRELMQFLRRINVAELFGVKTADGRNTGQTRWRLTSKMTQLWDSVMERMR